MANAIRIGAVSYLNTRTLVHGLEREPANGRFVLSYAPPAKLADLMAAGALDVALLPTIELARMPELEIVPGLGIVCPGPARSVLLASRRPLRLVRRVALDPESRTSNALARVLFAEVWGASPEFVEGPAELDDALAHADAAVRIGDKALFEPLPGGVAGHDLAAAWVAATGLPFVFAVWACRPGVLDRDLYGRLHASRRRGSAALAAIAADYRWKGRRHAEIAETYLRDNIRHRLGAAEVEAVRRFFDSAARCGAIARSPGVRLAFARRTACHEAAERRAAPALDRGL